MASTLPVRLRVNTINWRDKTHLDSDAVNKSTLITSDKKYYFGWKKTHKYLLLAELSVRTVNYGASFFPSMRLGHKSMEKNEDS